MKDRERKDARKTQDHPLRLCALALNESTVEEAALAQRLRDALGRLNHELPAEVLADACPKLTRPEWADLIQCNRALHRLLVDGVTVEYRLAPGQAGDTEGAIGG